MLSKGDKAPDFTATDQDGNPISLKDFKGKKLVLYFYPKDNTPGCTAQACDLRDNYSRLKKEGYEIIGVSPDTEASHLKFIEKYGLPFRLVSDTDKTVARAYGVWGRKKFMGRDYDGVFRTTFLIDEKGKIERVINKVKTKEHADQLLEDE